MYPLREIVLRLGFRNLRLGDYEYDSHQGEMLTIRGNAGILRCCLRRLNLDVVAGRIITPHIWFVKPSGHISAPDMGVPCRLHPHS